MTQNSQKYMKKTNKQKTHLLLQILAVISRYGPHLMIVMIVVTQYNFYNGPGISDHLLGFYPTEDYRPSPWILPDRGLDKLVIW